MIAVAFDIDARLARENEGDGMQPLDLAQRKVHLRHRDGLLPSHFAAVGAAQDRRYFVADRGKAVGIL